ncbi:TetR/AcrR family transcriptional regulator [Nocardioides daphniae]|nr:TetR/AcrR family transcriptional regulator [Nocardioides daphniae]GGD30740.1 hypothetical protein GCM10007231_32770 [Nocardioides daphniae]
MTAHASVVADERARFVASVRDLTDPVKGTTRHRVATEAMSLFARKGYGGASMREIGAAVGMQAASIYGHFPLGKKQILIDGLLDILDDFLVVVVEPVATGRPAREELVDLVTRHVGWRLDKGDMSLAWDAAYFGLGMTEVLEDRHMAALIAVVDQYRSYITALVGEVGDPAEAAGTARAVMSLCDTSDRLRLGPDEPREDVVARVVTLVLRCCRAE